MKILIIGANSYVGAKIYLELSKKYEVVGTYNSLKLSDNFIQLDITKKDKVKHLILQQKPDIIIHVANNANPRWCEANKELCIKVNQDSTKFIIDAVNKINAKLIYISSFTVLKPNNTYSKTKFESEKIVQQVRNGYLIIRPLFVLGFSPNIVNDRPFNRLLKNLDQNTPAVYDTSWKVQPCYLGHLCEVIELLIKRNYWNDTIPVGIKELKTRYDMAKDILGTFGIKVESTDAHDLTPIIKVNLSKLFKLDLPTYSYDQIIKQIILEIKNREQFKI